MVSEELLEMSVDQLKERLSETQAALTNLRFQKALQQLEDPSMIRTTRREIARIKTLIKEYELGKREVGAK